MSQLALAIVALHGELYSGIVSQTMENTSSLYMIHISFEKHLVPSYRIIESPVINKN